MTAFENLGQKLVAAGNILPQLLMTLAAGYICIFLLKIVFKNVFKLSKVNKPLRNIVLAVINVSMWVILMAILFQMMGLTQLSLVLSSLLPLAASIGASAFVADLISGLFLAQDRDFNIGDKIRVGDIEGVVITMDARKIRLEDDKGRLHVYPNSSFDKSSWIVLSTKKELNDH